MVRALLAGLVVMTIVLWPIEGSARSPDERFKADVLLVLAHPDDETAIGSFLAKLVFDMKKRIAVVYANRGTGGGNSHGEEQSHAMGLVREIEVRKGLASFGISNVWFLSGQDTPGQDVFASLQRWRHGVVLEELVRIVRLTRPEVILAWLPAVVAGENHGDHQAAGVIAVEAFDCAGDPSVFPSQIIPARERTDINNTTEGLLPWQSKKIYFFSDASEPVMGDGPPFDLSEISPSKKVPYYRLAIDLHRNHLTQGEVALRALEAEQTGDYSSFTGWLRRFRLLFGKSLVGGRPNGELFEGVTDEAIAFVRPKPQNLPETTGVLVEHGGAFRFYRQFWAAHDLMHLSTLREPELEVAVGSYVHVPLIVRNGTNKRVEVSLKPVIPFGWRLEYGPDVLSVDPGTEEAIQAFFTAPEEASDDWHEIRWEAFVGNARVSVASLKMKVREWTLPQ